MKKTLLFSVSFLFFCIISWSQGTLKGKITDSATAKPLGFATVTVFNAADTASEKSATIYRIAHIGAGRRIFFTLAILYAIYNPYSF